MNKNRSAIDKLDEFSEGTVIGLSIKALIAVGMTIATIVSMWFALQADIEEAKELPKPAISRTEFELKDELVQKAILDTEKSVEEIKESLNKIDQRLYELQRK